MNYEVVITWLIVIIIFFGIEALSGTFISVWTAIGSIAALAFYVAFHVSVLVQAVVFLSVSILCIALLRPVAFKKLSKKITKTNTESLIGKTFLLAKSIKPHSYGEVIISGTSWRVISVNENEYIKEGNKVIVKEVRGVTLVVEKGDV